MVSKTNRKLERERRHKRVRNKIAGTPERPRLSVFRSNSNIYVQLIDDVNGCTLAQASTLDKEVKVEVNSTLEYIDSRIESDFLWEVFNGIERLPKQCSRILKLSYLEGKNNAEIADFMGISINTVKSQKARAKLLLREYLKNVFE